MPYVKQNNRKFVDSDIECLADKFRNCFGHLDTGTANYIITRLILLMLKPNGGWSYESLSDVIKTLECSKLEITRRILNNYEDRKIFENGDVPELYNFANVVKTNKEE